MTSMGLRKDANSFSKLGRETLFVFKMGKPHRLKYNLFEKRLRSLLFEIQQYNQTKNPNNQTLIQRFFYWNIAFKAISTHWIFGHGTGGYKEAMSKQYKKASSILKVENQKTSQSISYSINKFRFIWVYTLVNNFSLSLVVF